jgi:putative ABC transport system ATP-binding protein
LPTEALIARCDRVAKIFRSSTGEVRALREVSAGFAVGAFSVVAGPSGSGKSSLLRLLAGLDRPTKGSVRVDDVEISTARSGVLRSLRRRTVGYVFQRPSDNFLPHLTVEEQLLRAGGRRRREPAVAFADLIEILELGPRLRHLPEQLSGGEQQRAAIAQVALSGARLIVADEPTAQLDTESALGVMDLLKTLTEAGVALVVASHDESIIRIADELVRLDHGERVADRDPRGRSVRLLDHVARDGSWPTVLHVEGLSKSYGKGPAVVRAVRDATFDVGAAEVVALVGRSGSGKTTLLNLVAGWERPDAGSVRIDGAERPKSPAWEDVAVVPQKLGLIDELSVRENIEYPARLAGQLLEGAPMIRALIDDLGLAELQGRYPSEISVGEQQRTALARALVLSPRLLVADEPSSHQDRGWTDDVFARIRIAADEGTACVAATHNEAIIPYLDRVLDMRDGLVVERIA